MKVDQSQPHENSWTACQSFQVVNWVKTKPGLAGNQIPFGGTRFGFTTEGVYNTSIIDTTWNDWQAVQEFSWGWHWSTFKNIGC